MEPTQFVLPAVATVALGTALLVPLRDGRPGRRATPRDVGFPLRLRFGTHPVERAGFAPADGTPVATVDTPAESLETNAPVGPQPDVLDAASSRTLQPFATEDVPPKGPYDNACTRLVRLGIRLFGLDGKAESDANASRRARPMDEAAQQHVERSFAGELNALLDAASHVDENPTRSSETKPKCETAFTGFVDPANEPIDVSSHDAVIENTHAERLLATAAPTLAASRFANSSEERLSSSASVPLERVVPITRLPLRPQGLAITWTRDLSETERSPIGDLGRRDILERLQAEPGVVSFATIERAYHEEDGLRRRLALRVLVAHHGRAARDVFVDVLRTGSDDERALAVEGLVAGGAHGALPAAFTDRVEAIAARAAFEYVGFADRETYRTALSPYVDAARLDALLVLLAGIIE